MYEAGMKAGAFGGKLLGAERAGFHSGFVHCVDTGIGDLRRHTALDLPLLVK
ncbi:hypothetical protein D3C83_160520 [compost metagenome]